MRSRQPRSYDLTNSSSLSKLLRARSRPSLIARMSAAAKIFLGAGPNSGLFFGEIVTKDESDFSHCSRLTFVHARRAESGTWNVVDRMNKGEISADKDPAVLKRRRCSDGGSRAAWTEDEVGSLLRSVPRTRYVLPAPSERETAF